MIRLFALLLVALAPSSPSRVYSAWAEDGRHLMIADSGTETPEDDFVCDWEDNRVFEVIHD